jgi:putative radical SAM enzyme (TIGR03279 family)
MSLGGHALQDVLDLHFYLSSDPVSLLVQRGSGTLETTLDCGSESEPGWELEPLTVRTCRCNCIFCFVQQLPTGLRSSLYVKDEDYRFSFLFGSYLTLVGFNSRDLERVLRLRLSPLYVSIHTTDSALRGALLGLKRAPVMPLLKKLIAGGIQIHGQIVLVPGYNDDEALRRSLDELRPLFPGLASLSIVPVGLTSHRFALENLRPVTIEGAKTTLDLVRKTQARMLKETGSRWVFPADELLLIAGESFYEEADYEDYPQLDNGVGLVRWTMTQAFNALDKLPTQLDEPRRLFWVTGQSAAATLKEIALSYTSACDGLEIEIIPIQNHLLGNSVTVAGLLGGQDIVAGIEDYFKKANQRSVDMIYLPPSCLNTDGVLLDDWTAGRISARIRVPVKAFDGCWEAMILPEKEGESA